jgi:hypothetical protein
VVEVLSVQPDQMKDLKPDAFLSVALNFESKAKLSKLVKTLAEEYNICKLVPTFKPKSGDGILHPQKQFFRGKHAIIDFNFKLHSSMIKS